MSSPAIAALRHTLPYLRMFRKNIFVIKVSGAALLTEASTEQTLEQIAILHSLGIQVVLVHGGSAQADALSQRLGVESQKIEGRRVTSPDMAAAMILALNGEVQARLLSCARKLHIDAIGMSGMDAGLILAKRRGPTKLSDGTDADFGEVGDILSVNPQAITALLEQGVIPIISPLTGDAEGRWLNTNADTVAAEIAQSLKAQKVIFLTGAPGILRDVSDPNSLISELSLEELKSMIESGCINDGMLPKAAAIKSCIDGGIDRVHVVSYAIKDALLTEVFTNEGSGTLIQ